MQLRRFAVIGHPIGHTMSPFIHDRLFSLTGHKPEYSVLDVPSLTQALPALRTLDGFNITIPHKSDIIPLLDGIDEKAKLFGSVNTVRVEGGKMTGYTTDGVPAAKRPLRAMGSILTASFFCSAAAARRVPSHLKPCSRPMHRILISSAAKARSKKHRCSAMNSRSSAARAAKPACSACCLMTSSQRKPGTTISCSTPQASVCTPKPVSVLSGKTCSPAAKPRSTPSITPAKPNF